MNMNSFVLIATGTLLTTALAAGTGYALTRPERTRLLPAVNVESVIIEPETPASGSTEMTEPAFQVESFSLVMEEPDVKETSAPKATAKTSKKAGKKQSAKVNYTYGSSRYNNGDWTAVMNLKEDDSAVIEIVHETFDDDGVFFTDHWIITGKLDKAAGTLEYSGGINTTLKYDRTGRHENKIYNNGTGIIEFSGNSFSWTDTFRNEAHNLKLTKRV